MSNCDGLGPTSQQCAPICDCDEPADCRRCPFAMQRIEQLEGENNKLDADNLELMDEIERLEADKQRMQNNMDNADKMLTRRDAEIARLEAERDEARNLFEAVISELDEKGLKHGFRPPWEADDED